MSGRGTYSYPVKQESNPTPWDRNDTYPVGHWPNWPNWPNPSTRHFAEIVAVDQLFGLGPGGVSSGVAGLGQLPAPLDPLGNLWELLPTHDGEDGQNAEKFQETKAMTSESRQFFLSKIDHVYRNNELYIIRYVSKHHSWCNDTWKAIHT